MTVRSLIFAEKMVTVTGSLGAMSVEPNLGLALTRTLLFSAVDELAGAAWEPSKTGNRDGGRAVEVTVTTSSSWELAQPETSSSAKMEQGGNRRRPSAGSPDCATVARQATS